MNLRCYLLSLLRIHHPDCERCAREKYGVEMRKRLEELTGRPSSPISLAQPSARGQILISRLETPKSSQFRAVEVATLEKRQRKFENPGLSGFEREFLGALGRGADRSDFILIAAASLSDFPLDDNPGPTSGTGHARAHNAISHTKIIECF